MLLTGASGMLGRYVEKLFSPLKGKEFSGIYTLGRNPENSFETDLEKEIPDFGDRSFNLVVHCAGTEEESGADSLNYNGTLNLLKALEKNPPRQFVFISSWQVYSPDAGENVNEDSNTWPVTEVGKSKIRAEKAIKEWGDKRNVVTTILRPARMFGKGVSGETLRLFNDALRGNYIHIRGNDARQSIVTAYNVAECIFKLREKGGVYNVADGFDPRLIDIVEAMTANAGSKKRMVHLPPDWAEWIWRLGRWIPVVNNNLHPSIVDKRLKTFTLDPSRCHNATGLKFFDTIAVIERTDEEYPYEDME